MLVARVATARLLQTERYQKLAHDKELSKQATPRTNAEADGEFLEAVAAPDTDGRTLLTTVAEKMKLSARAYHRVLRVARTLADLQAHDTVNRRHMAEALSYRRIGVGK